MTGAAPQEDEIDLLALFRYLLSKWHIILAFSAIPVCLYLLIIAFQSRSFGDKAVEAIVFVDKSQPFTPGELISERLIQMALNNNHIKAEASEVVGMLTVTPGYTFINAPLRTALAQLSGDVALGRTDKPDEIRRRYDNLAANRDRFLTLTFDLEDAPFDKAVARVLLSEMIALFNRDMQSRIGGGSILSEIDTSKIYQIGALNAFSLSQLRSTAMAVSATNQKLESLGFNKQGYLPELISSRLSYILLQIDGMIGSSDFLSRFFLNELTRKIETAEDKIGALDRVLSKISKDDDIPFGGSRPQTGEKGMMATEYNAELFDRFLNVGATLSLVDYQQNLLKEKLELEFELARDRELDVSLRRAQSGVQDPEATYQWMVSEIGTLAATVNEYIQDYQNNFQRPAAEMITLNNLSPPSLLSPKVLALVVIGSLGLATVGVLLWKAF